VECRAHCQQQELVAHKLNEMYFCHLVQKEYLGVLQTSVSFPGILPLLGNNWKNKEAVELQKFKFSGFLMDEFGLKRNAQNTCTN
jgi:hypothetical protein